MYNICYFLRINYVYDHLRYNNRRNGENMVKPKEIAAKTMTPEKKKVDKYKQRAIYEKYIIFDE